jgi:hypothetical protein
MVDYTVSKTGSGSEPWEIKREGETVVQRFSTKAEAESFARSNYKGQQVLIFYANKPGIDKSIVPGDGKKKDSGIHRGLQL